MHYIGWGMLGIMPKIEKRIAFERKKEYTILAKLAIYGNEECV